jgi:hypothetical protein
MIKMPVKLRSLILSVSIVFFNPSVLIVIAPSISVFEAILPQMTVRAPDSLLPNSRFESSSLKQHNIVRNSSTFGELMT